MEAKLREYRAVRRRKELIENAKEKLEKTKDKLVNFLVPNIFKDMDKDKNEEEVLLVSISITFRNCHTMLVRQSVPTF